MTAYATNAPGNWATGAIWTPTAPAGGPTTSDTATINHAVTVAANAGCGALAINAALAVSAGATLTVAGNVTQGNALFTLSAGAALVFSTAGGSRKWLMGTAVSQTSCKLLASGTAGSHASISKTGGNYAWFDVGDEGAGGSYDCSELDLTYCDFAGISNSDGTLGFGISTFGSNNIKLSHCTFDACGRILRSRPYKWAGSANTDYYVRDCTFAHSVDTYSASIKADGSSGSGAHDVTRNSFDNAVEADSKIDLVDNYFGHGMQDLGGPFLSNVGNLYRIGNGDQDQIISTSISDSYWLAALDHPGNPHCFTGIVGGSTISGCVFEYPIASAVDSGECVYGHGGDAVIVTGNLGLPSETDGFALGNIANNARSSGTDAWSVTHNTMVGANNAYIAYSEAGSDPAAPLYSAVKSNLVVDPSGSVAAVVFEVGASTNVWTDLVLGANATHNGKYGPVSFVDPASGHNFPGYKARFSATPGANDVTGNPNFLDATRNFANWAVYKGAALLADSLATRTAAAVALIAATPALIRSDLVPWVRAGFAPTNSAFHNTAHDGADIGAVSFSAPVGGGSVGAERLEIAIGLGV